MKMGEYDIIIIGGGISGLTAAVYSCRKKLSTLVLSEDFTGQTAWAWELDNFPGFLGKLDAAGESTAQFNAPALPPGCVGLRMYFAFCMNNPFDYASNPEVVEIIP